MHARILIYQCTNIMKLNSSFTDLAGIKHRIVAPASNLFHHRYGAVYPHQGGGGGSRDERQASHPVGVASRRPCGGRYDIPVGGVEEERLELAAVEYERLSSGYRIQGGGGARGIRQL